MSEHKKSSDAHIQNADSDMNAQNEKMPSQAELDKEIAKNKAEGTYGKTTDPGEGKDD